MTWNKNQGNCKCTQKDIAKHAWGDSIISAARRRTGVPLRVMHNSGPCVSHIGGCINHTRKITVKHAKPAHATILPAKGV